MPEEFDSHSVAARLRDAERRLSGVLAMTAEAIICADGDHRIVVFNRGAEEIFGYRPEEILGAALETLLSESVHGVHPLNALRSAESAETPRRTTARHAMIARRKNGETFDAEVSVGSVRAAGVGLVTVVVHDVSALIAEEGQLLRSEADLRGLVERATFGILRSTLGGHLLMVNPALAEMLDYNSVKDLLSMGDMVTLYQHPEDRGRLLELYRTHELFKNVEAVWKRKDGTPLTVRLSGRPVRGSNPEQVTLEVFVENDSERVVLEQQLIQSQKMESVGRLAGGIAHDFNNLLTVILSWTEMAMAELPADHMVRSSLQEVFNAGQRAAGLTRQLLAFSRQQVVEPTIFDVNVLVVETDNMLRRLIGEDIELVIRTAPQLGTVKMDRGQLAQVLMNLAVNAADAMPGGGKLTIETSNVFLDASYTQTNTDVTPADYVLIAVTDSGTGMSEEVKTHLFEPFFTTKEPGKGTGLGLATSYGIVKQAGGHITAVSKEGLGTTMKVYLPRSAEAAVTVASRPRKTPMHGVETILLVEDEPAVRRVTVRLLETQGYRVVSTTSGEEALRLIEDGREPLDLLLTDVVLAGRMSGPALAERVRLVRPHLKVLFASGYTRDVTTLQGLLEEGNAFIPKPFTAESLGEKVRQVLDAK